MASYQTPATKAAPMTDAKINAIAASGFNYSASEISELRSLYPSGMRPADASRLDRCVRAGWVTAYADRLNAGKIEDSLFTSVEVQSALDALGFPLGN